MMITQRKTIETQTKEKLDRYEIITDNSLNLLFKKNMKIWKMEYDC